MMYKMVLYTKIYDLIKNILFQILFNHFWRHIHVCAELIEVVSQANFVLDGWAELEISWVTLSQDIPKHVVNLKNLSSRNHRSRTRGAQNPTWKNNNGSSDPQILRVIYYNPICLSTKRSNLVMTESEELSKLKTNILHEIKNKNKHLRLEKPHTTLPRLHQDRFRQSFAQICLGEFQVHRVAARGAHRQVPVLLHLGRSGSGRAKMFGWR